ncbi:gonadotropin-releasing hormone II receptor-like isoform X2 [Ornithodoros turicata]|uniref:gonadotropin-releasing hormone II receptor-like isoform X2 n=1 Tax=Ornithodoros turicata TaxID=34597 RepID=UPI0031388D46
MNHDPISPQENASSFLMDDGNLHPSPFFTFTLITNSLNATTNTTLSTDIPSLDQIFGPRYHSRVRICIILIMIVFSIIGNSVVCCKLLMKKRRTRYSKAQVLFLNLALADLLVTLVTMTSQTVWEVMGRVWIAGDAFCRMFKVLQTFTLASSTYMLISIALDRHFAIVSPLSSCPGPWRLALAAWGTALVPSVPNLYVFRLVDIGSGVCYCASLFYTDDTPLLYRQMYMTFVFLTVFIVPLVLLVALYSRILVEIWRQSAAVKSRQQTASSLPKAKVKTLKMTVVVFAAFIVTNVPYMVQEIVLAFASSPNILDRNVVALFGVISASNSAINPYIYLFFQKKKRKRFTSPFCMDILGNGARIQGRKPMAGWLDRRCSSFFRATSMNTATTKDIEVHSMDCTRKNNNAGCSPVLRNGGYEIAVISNVF